MWGPCLEYGGGVLVWESIGIMGGAFLFGLVIGILFGVPYWESAGIILSDTRYWEQRCWHRIS